MREAGLVSVGKVSTTEEGELLCRVERVEERVSGLRASSAMARLP